MHDWEGDVTRLASPDTGLLIAEKNIAEGGVWDMAWHA
jgi:hypothetical protein